LNPGAGGLAEAGVIAAGSAIAAAAFAFASYAPLRSLLPIAVIAAAASAVFTGVEAQDLGRAWAAATAAVMIGVVSYAVAGRIRVPPLVVVVPAIVPLLPGLSIYRGLTLLATGGNGILSLMNAVAIAIALAAGVLLGEHFAQPLKREARRLENRLAGPRLVGLLRARAVNTRTRVRADREIEQPADPRRTDQAVVRRPPGCHRVHHAVAAGRREPDDVVRVAEAGPVSGELFLVVDPDPAGPAADHIEVEVDHGDGRAVPDRGGADVDVHLDPAFG